MWPVEERVYRDSLHNGGTRTQLPYMAPVHTTFPYLTPRIRTVILRLSRPRHTCHQRKQTTKRRRSQISILHLLPHRRPSSEKRHRNQNELSPSTSPGTEIAALSNRKTPTASVITSVATSGNGRIPAARASHLRHSTSSWQLLCSRSPLLPREKQWTAPPRTARRHQPRAGAQALVASLPSTQT